MTILISKILGLSAALVVVSVATSSRAYSWGQLNTYHAPYEQQCSATVTANVEAYEVTSHNGVVTEGQHMWGQDAVNLLTADGMPIQIRDDGNDCAKYNNVTVSLIFAEGRQDSTFHAYVGNWFDYGPGWYGELPDIYLRKSAPCSGNNNYHATRGTGGGGQGYWFTWEIRATYYKDYTGNN